MGAKKRNAQTIDAPVKPSACKDGKAHKLVERYRNEGLRGADSVTHACVNCGKRVIIHLKPYNWSSLTKPWRYFHRENRKRSA